MNCRVTPALHKLDVRTILTILFLFFISICAPLFGQDTTPCDDSDGDGVSEEPFTSSEGSYWDTVYCNPNLNPSIVCGGKIILVLDESGSINHGAGNSEINQVRGGVDSLLTAFLGSGTEVALVRFDDQAKIAQVNGSVYTEITESSIDTLLDWVYNTGTFSGNGYGADAGQTDYAEAMDSALVINNVCSADLMVFFTDGNPNPTSSLLGGIVAGNEMKMQGTHLLSVGVGSGFDMENIRKMSGDDLLDLNNPDISVGDYVGVTDFDDLGDFFKMLADEICAPKLFLEKAFLEDVCVCPDSTVSFSLTAWNTSSFVPDSVLVKDTVPCGFTNLSYIGPEMVTIVQDSIVCWYLDTLGIDANDSLRTITISAQVTDCPDFTNIAVLTVKDFMGLSDTASIQVDLSPPIITCPSDITIECDEQVPSIITLADFISASGDTSDNCAVDPGSFMFLGETISPGSCPVIDTVMHTFQIADDCGQASSCVRNIIRQDTEPPVFICPNDTTVSCSVDLPIISNYSQFETIGGSASDNCMLSPISFAPLDTTIVAGVCPAIDTFKVRYTISDQCGLLDTCTYSIARIDTTAPMFIVAPRDTMVQCNGMGNEAVMTSWISANGGGDAGDLCTNIMWDTTLISRTIDCGNARTDSIWFIISDDCGNTDSLAAEFKIIDTIDPYFTIYPTDYMAECGPGQLDSISAWIDRNGNGEAADDCSGVKWNNDFFLDPTACDENNMTNVTFTVTDSCGNDTSYTVILTVMDTGPPTITEFAMDTTVQCDGMGNEFDLTAWIDTLAFAEAIDECGGVFWDTAYISTSVLCGNTRVDSFYFIAIDACGNMDSVAAKFEIIDSIDPSFTVFPKDTMVQCDGSGNELDIAMWIDSVGFAVAIDGCSMITWDTALISSTIVCGNTRVDSIWFYAIDGCGNADSAAAKFEIIDTIPPSFTPLADFVFECGVDDDTTTNNTGIIQPIDGCVGSVEVSYEDIVFPGGCPKTYTIHRVWTATDACNYIQIDTQYIMILDTQDPEIVCPEQFIAECNLNEQVIYTSFREFVDSLGSATDECGLDTSSFHLSSTISEMIGESLEITRTYAISDSCGNMDSCAQLIILMDITAPEITCVDTFFVTADESGVAIVELDSFLIDTSDNCAVDFVEILRDSFNCGFVYNQDRFETVTLRVHDEAGLSATCSSVLVVSCPCPPEPFLVCNEMLNVSLGPDCMLVIRPDDILEGAVFDCYNDYKVDVINQYGKSIGNKVDESHIGQTLTVCVTDTMGLNKCWGKIRIEDKSPPLVECRDTIISCFIDPNLPLYESSSEGCLHENRIEVVDEEWIEFACGENDTLIGQYIREVAAFDKWGNMRICEQTISVRKESLDSLVCPEEKAIVYCDDEKFSDPKYYKQVGDRKVPIPVLENGQSIGLVDPPKLGDVFVDVSTGACNIMVTYEDHFYSHCGNTFEIQREWRFVDWCEKRDTSCIQFIKIMDSTAPVLVLDETIVTQVGPHECKAKITLERPEFIEECSDPESVKIFYNVSYFDYGYPVKQHNITGLMTEDVEVYLPIGTHYVEYTANDLCWNVSHFIQIIEVEDITPPTAVCDEYTAVTLDLDNCEAKIFAVDLSDGTHDNCCQQIHYAVASMDSIEYWTNHWQSYFNSCYGEYLAQEMQPQINSYIDEWINCFVFEDAITLAGCVSDSLVLRSYEACGMRPYDSHLFKGTTHQWYCFQRFESYAQYYVSTLHQQNHYEVPKPDLDCHPEGISLVLNEDSLSENMNDPIISKLYESRLEFSSLYSECMIEVSKADKEAPVCEPLADIVTYCDLLDGNPDYLSVLNVCDVTELPGTDFNLPWVQSDGNGYYGGPVLHDYEYEDCNYETWKGMNMAPESGSWKPIYCRAWLELDSQEDDYPHIDPESLFGEPVVWDNCTPVDQLLDTVYVTGELDECGEGHLTKVWKFVDICGNETTCHQDLYIYHRSDFEVLFPEDMRLNCQEMNDVSATEEGSGIPEVFDADCEAIAISHVDTYLNDEEDGCYKIIRHWTVVDWCKYDPDAKIYEPDVIVNDSIVASEDRACVYRYLKDGGNGVIRYVQILKVIDEIAPVFVSCLADTILCLEDDCGPLTVNLDLGTATDNCANPENLIYHWNVSQGDAIFGTGEDTLFSYNLDPGVYTIDYYARDLCQNRDTCNTTLTVVDCKAPTPICLDGVTTVIMGSSGSIAVWAIDLINKTNDNCSASEDIKVSFSEDTDSTSMVFTCEMMSNGIEEYFEVEVWVTDEAENKSRCRTSVKIQDNDHCPDNLSSVFPVGGRILTKNNFAVPNTTVELNSETLIRPEAFTDDEGFYELGYLPIKSELGLIPSNNTELLKGVSTRDIVRIQKHLLGIEPFSDPEQYIAADINNSKSVSAIDIVDLRKVILGIYKGFPNNKSWRFRDKTYEMTMDNPFDIKERIAIEELTDESMNSDFMGIKVGDVNGSYSNVERGILIRDKKKQTIYLEQTEDKSIVELSSDISSIEGMQFRVRIPESSPFSVITNGVFVDDNIAITKEPGFNILTVSWNKSKMAAGESRIMTLKGVSLYEIAIDETFTNEAYHASEELMYVEFEIRDSEELFKLYQNKPNPFINTTQISFYNPKDQVISIRLMDVVGKTIFTEKGSFSKGTHEFDIKASSWKYSGVIYYTIDTESESASGKMIKID